MVSLYTSIDVQEGLDTIKCILSKTDLSDKGQSFLLELLELILTRNYFSFDNKFFLQRRGTAMGANVAPTFANLFVASLEEGALYDSHHFQKVLGRWRYIDDIFLVWTGTQQELDDPTRWNVWPF